MKINGIGASDGIAIYKAFSLEEIKLNITDESISDVESEMSKFTLAIEETKKQLSELEAKTAIDLDEEHAMIFKAHMMIAEDPEIVAQTTELIKQSMNAAFALKSVTDTFIKLFESMDDEYMKERAADIKDVTKRVTANLLGVKLNNTTITEAVIVVANDLTPSDTAQLDKNFVKGFITNIGGRTSHSAIMARGLEIPAIVGTEVIMDNVNNGDMLILDGANGVVIVNPTVDEINEYTEKQKKYLEEKAIWKQYIDKKSVSLDNKHVEFAANIGSPDDLDLVLKTGAEGVGLYRTEFLYMNNSALPTEEQQFSAYKKVLEALGSKKVVIRTLDIGGDKHLPYFEMDEELNPFLGHRALRLCLEEKVIFKTQLRALLRASVYGNLHIMFPMVATIDELRKARELLIECKEELVNEGLEVGEYKVGIMVEIPAVAVAADVFAKEVDFFSIGTNDLIQYTFAADRMNTKVSYLYQPYNPSLLRLIKMVIDASHKEGIWTGMCGEMAGEQLAIPLLLGLGLDEFSMSASSILRSRHLLSKLDSNEMVELSKQCLEKSSEEEVIKLIKEYSKNS